MNKEMLHRLLARIIYTYRQNRARSIGLGVGVVLAFLAIFVLPHTDADGARAFLQAKGYSQVDITGFSFFSCDGNTMTKTGFRAFGPDGKPTSGTVCHTPGWGNWLSWF